MSKSPLGLASSLRANGSRWIKCNRKPIKEGAAAADIFVDSERLAMRDFDRVVVFNGKGCFPPITVRPRIEAWNYRKLETESKLLTEPEKSNFFGTKNLLLVGTGLLAIGGLLYYYRRRQRKLFESKVASAAAASVQDSFSQAIQEGLDQAVQGAAAAAFGSAAVQQAIDRAVQNSAQGVIAAAATASASARHAIAPVRTSDLSTEEVLQAYVDAGGVAETNLQSFLDTFGLISSLPTVELTVKQCLLSSLEDMVKSGITEDYAEKMQKAVFSLLTHHLRLV